MEGDINNENYVLTKIKDDGINFDVNYEYGHFQSTSTDIGYNTYISPFSTNIRYVKAFSNYGYIIDDVSNDEFNQNNYNCNIVDGKNKWIWIFYSKK
jgi:hypothetical protein